MVYIWFIYGVYMVYICIANYSIHWFCWEKLQENPIFPGKIYGFRLRFYLFCQPIELPKNRNGSKKWIVGDSFPKSQTLLCEFSDHTGLRENYIASAKHETTTRHAFWQIYGRFLKYVRSQPCVFPLILETSICFMMIASYFSGVHLLHLFWN